MSETRYERTQSRSRGLTAVALVACAVVVGASCGSSSKSSSSTPTTTADPVAAAQARVTTAQTNVTNAQQALTTANQQFCTAGKDYVTTLDKYGKILDQSAATVGDVKTAGSDIAAPRADVESAINGVSTARNNLTAAQKELADANTALDSAKANASGTPTSPSTAAASTTTTTVVSATTVDRVKQAESDFTKALSGISDQTPVATAGIAVNSAAFALEATWLQLLSESGCLTDAQQTQAVDKVQEYTTALQKELQTAGYYKGAVDGIYGPQTADAVKQLQTDSKLPVTGFPDQATTAALDAKVKTVTNVNTAASLVNVSALQTILKLGGYWTGPVNGQWTPELTTALKQMQTALGVPATGILDEPTLSAIETKITQAKSSTTTTTAPAQTTTTT